jgi:hypothetical protein
MNRRLLAVALLAAGIVALLGGFADATAPAGSERAQLLRLNDLPLGYLGLELVEEHGTRPECTPLTEPEDTPPRMLRFVRRYHPRGCIFGYQLLFGDPAATPGALAVGTGVLDAKSPREARAGWAVLPEMLGRLVGDHPPKVVGAPKGIGAEARLFHSSARILPGSGRQPVTFLAWRSGTTLATVATIGRTRAIDDAAAKVLARRQQAHIAKPTPYTNAESYEGEVPLEAPGLDLPVLWLGRNFAPGGGLPPLHLSDSYFSGEAIAERSEEGFAEGPYPPLRLRYAGGITLSTWGAAEWPTYANSKTGKALVTWKCTKAKTIAVASGTATIYAGYKKDLAKCPSSPPEAFLAWVKAGEDTVVVNEPFAADSIGAGVEDRYESLAGMEAVVGALRPRD